MKTDDAGWAECDVVVNGETVHHVAAASPEGSMYQAILMFDTMTTLFVQCPTNRVKLDNALKASTPMWEKVAA